MGKLLLLSFLATVVVAELDLFPDSSGLYNGAYDEDFLAEQLFGSRERRQAENDPPEDNKRGLFDPLWKFEERRFHGKPEGQGPGQGRPPHRRPPPVFDDGEMCPPMPRNDTESPDAEQGPPPGPPSGGPPPPPPGDHPPGPPPPGHEGRRHHPPMVRCCNITEFIDNDISDTRKECRKEIFAKMRSESREQRGGCRRGMDMNVTACVFEKLSWSSDNGTKIDSTAMNAKVDSMSNLSDEEKTFYKSTFTSCAGSCNSTSTFVRCVRRTSFTDCPSSYVSTKCTTQCEAWTEKARASSS